MAPFLREKYRGAHRTIHVVNMEQTEVAACKNLKVYCRHCKEYEDAIKAAGGIDLQLLGLGRMGHIGFNEQGCAQRI